MNELQKFVSTEDKTPIEVALQMDEDGAVSTRKLYEFLELEPDNFTTWCKRNILENEFAAENEDYHEAFFEKGFVSPSGGSYKRTLVDYKLNVPFAKKLCMIQRNERGEQARDYFILVEDKLKAVAQNKNLPKLTTNEMVLKLAESAVEMERKINALEQSQTAIEQKLDTAVKIFAKPGSDWKENMEMAIRDLMDAQGITSNSYFQKLYNEMDVVAGIDLKSRLGRLRGRKIKHGAKKTDCKYLTKLDVISEDKQLRPIFEGIVKKYQAVYGAQKEAI